MATPKYKVFVCTVVILYQYYKVPFMPLAMSREERTVSSLSAGCLFRKRDNCVILIRLIILRRIPKLIWKNRPTKGC
jgi:hypothetical protein